MSSFCLRQIETRCDDEKFFNIECRRGGCEELSVVRQTIAMWDAAALLGGLTNYFPIDNPTQLNPPPCLIFFDILTFLTYVLPFWGLKKPYTQMCENMPQNCFKTKQQKNTLPKLFLWLSLKFKLLWHNSYFQFCPDIFVWGFENVIFPFSPNSQFFWQKPKTLNLIGSLSQIAFN